MSRPTTARLAAAAALAATLALTSPAPAGAAERSPSDSLRQWLQGLLPQRIAALWTRGQGGPDREESGRAGAKQGVALDAAGAQSNPLSGPTCRQWNEQGGCIDPDG